MRTAVSLVFFCLALGLAGAARAEEWTVKMRAVSGKVTYSHDLKVPEGGQASYAGKAQMRGYGPAREIIFNAYLKRPDEGLFRLDYQVEVAGEQKARPPFQAQGKVLLRPGKQALAVEAGGWKLIFEVAGKVKGEPPQKEGGVLETALKCGRRSWPARFLYLPGEQYTAVLYGGTEDEVSKFMVGLLPNSTAVDGEFILQYTLQLKDAGETLAEGQGELALEPGGGKAAAKAGKGCVFSAKALR